MKKSPEEIKEELQNYYGTTMVSGFPMAMAELNELEGMSDEELTDLTEERNTRK